MCRHRVEITVKVKANMQFKKIFEVAEVLGAVHSVYAHALITTLIFRNDSAKNLVRASLYTSQTQEYRPGCV